MALDEAPPFWWKPPSWRAILLWPFGFAYGRIADARLNAFGGKQVKVPVLCVGNFIVGGGGKTPTVQLICKQLKAKGFKPGVLSRGYGGAVTTATVVDTTTHNAHDLGDEPLLHAEKAVTVVSSDRAKGATLLIEQGCDFIVMDDGFQNPSLFKDFNLIVVDSKRGLGNGFTMPAGPLRIPLKQQLMRTDALLIVGSEDEGLKVVRKAARMAKPVFHAFTKTVGKTDLKGKKVLAFAGIADPSKFYDTLEELGAEVAETQSFGDHHLLNEEECGDLIDRAKREKLHLVTTTKDTIRLVRMGRAQQDLADMTTAVPIELKMEDPDAIDRIIASTRKRFEARKLA